MKRILLVLIAIIAIGARASHADAIPPGLIPAGLNPGDQFRLVFVTSTPHDAQSSDITVYDAFVNSVANSVGSLLLPLGLNNWLAIGSTATVNAKDHIHDTVDNVPIYNLLLQQVSPDEAGLWDGNIDAPIAYTEGKNFMADAVWTGTGADGTTSGLFVTPLGGGSPVFGISDQTSSSWIASDFFIPFPPPATESLPFYAISPVLTVPSVPEPETVTLLITGLLGLAGAVRNRKIPKA